MDELNKTGRGSALRQPRANPAPTLHHPAPTDWLYPGICAIVLPCPRCDLFYSLNESREYDRPQPLDLSPRLSVATTGCAPVPRYPEEGDLAGVEAWHIVRGSPDEHRWIFFM